MVRGEYKKPAAAIPRRYLEAFDPKPFATSGSGRLELAEKIASPDNPLTARVMTNRLRIEDLLKRHPEILEVPIDRPIFIAGLPRSGTTHLVNLLAEDRRRRALPYWESQEPIPSRGEGPDLFGVDPRYARARSEHDALMASSPLVAAMHDRFPEAIEEEVELLDLDFAGYVLEWHARVPD